MHKLYYVVVKMMYMLRYDYIHVCIDGCY